jgi:hypothetical protein
MDDMIGTSEDGGIIVDEEMSCSLFMCTPTPLRSLNCLLHNEHHAEANRGILEWIALKCLVKFGQDLIMVSQMQQ